MSVIVNPGGGASIPAGIICMWSGTLANVPSGWALCDGTAGTPDLRQKFIKGWTAGVDPGGTGGALTHNHAAHSYTPAGTVSQPTFTGSALGTHSHGVGTYANGAVSAGTPTGTIAWPLGVPTFSGAALGTHLHGVGTYANTAISAGTPAGTIAWPVGVPTIAWPAGVPILTMNSYTPAGTIPNSAQTKFSTSASGTLANTTAARTFTGTAATLTGTIAWPAGVPTNTWPVGVPTFSGSALGTHNHTFSGSSEAISAGTPSGTIAWPAGVPTFTGDALGTHNHTITGSSEAISAGTPAGTVSQPTFTGNLVSLTHDSVNHEPPYFILAFIMKS